MIYGVPVSIMSDAPRGLRLAPTSSQSDEGTPEASDDDTDPPDTPTPAPAGSRPALKRIK